MASSSKMLKYNVQTDIDFLYFGLHCVGLLIVLIISTLLQFCMAVFNAQNAAANPFTKVQVTAQRESCVGTGKWRITNVLGFRCT